MQFSHWPLGSSNNFVDQNSNSVNQQKSALSQMSRWMRCHPSSIFCLKACFCKQTLFMNALMTLSCILNASNSFCSSYFQKVENLLRKKARMKQKRKKSKKKLKGHQVRIYSIRIFKHLLTDQSCVSIRQHCYVVSTLHCCYYVVHISKYVSC